MRSTTNANNSNSNSNIAKTADRVVSSSIFAKTIFAKTFGQDYRDTYNTNNHSNNNNNEDNNVDPWDTTTTDTEDLLSFGSSSDLLLDLANCNETDNLSFCDDDSNNNNNNNNNDYDELVVTATAAIAASISAPAVARTMPPTLTDNIISSGSSSSSSSSGNSNNIKNDNTSRSNNNNNKKKVSEQRMEDMTKQMGKLWWPIPNQDICRKYERDKHGRLLVPDEIRTGGSGKINTNANVTANGNSNTNVNSTTAGGNSSSSSSSKNSDKINNSKSNNNGSEGINNKNNLFQKTFVGVVSAANNVKLQSSLALANTMDKVWAKELYEMDAKEREDVSNELHGVQSNRTIIETPEMIDDQVQSLRDYIETNIDKELDNGDSIVPPVTKDAYKRGVYHLKSEYIQTKAFLLKFLRTSLFDIEKAALRYFRYLDLLYILFGDTALVRQLALTNLTKREMRYLKTGQMQLMPSRDRAGRRIYAFSGCDDWNYNIREKYRTNIYLLDVVSDDETTQKLGGILLSAPRVGPGDNPFGFEGMTLRGGKQELLGDKFTEAQFYRKINEALPFRLTGIHFFAPDTIIYHIGKAIMLSLMGKDDRKVARFHAGSQLECNYKLRSFGIPSEDVTITDGANIKTKNVQKFINARRSIEMFREEQQDQRRQGQQQHQQQQQQQEKACPGIECPEVDCIVFGDKTMNSIPANLEFRDILKIMERDREEKLARCENNITNIKDFIETIIKVAQSPEHKLRFLMFDKKKHLFVVIKDHNELCKRVSQALRDQRKRSRVEEQRLLEATATVRTKMNNNNSYNYNNNNNNNNNDTNEQQEQEHHHRRQRHQHQQQQQRPHDRFVLDDGGSMMGLDVAKRLKRSSNNNSNSGGPGLFFCTR